MTTTRPASEGGDTALPQSGQTVTITLTVTGPIKRSTFQKDAVLDPVDEAIRDILHWCWCTRLQAGRFGQSWRRAFGAMSGRPRLRSQRLRYTASYDEHMFLVAAANLDKALSAAPEAIQPTTQLAEQPRRALKLLRNIYEHWDELRRKYRSGDLDRSAADLRREFPNADPWSSTFDAETGEVLLVADVVEVKPLLLDTRKLEAKLLRIQRTRARNARQRAAEPLSGCVD